ncbi:aldolase/citrate lyase family protein [Daejeonella sp.]|uniref:HpcH/HpaI aldolase family protein n=1 Tax=Daejeonella sp. TaxID=2805397 RepID=UPI002B5F184E|nr:aldolase/citrate lyase family protein [Daejeonella sp.]HQT58854.1 aldolase/citrate lyase family protein [Daejeonella sp.]
MQIGSWITLNNISVAELMADAGFDWLCIDMEHTATDYFEAQQMMIAIQAKGIPVYVRVGSNDPLIIKRVLDAGADGIIVPSVNSKSDAERAISAVKYPPIGTRGVGLARAQGYGFNFDNYRDVIAPKVKLIVQIEHINAIDELDDILSLEGVDGSFIGPYDLSGSLGKPGQYNDEDVMAAIERYELTAKKYNKWIGFHVVPPDYKLVEEKQAKGYNFIAFSFDAYFMGHAIREQLKNIKN